MSPMILFARTVFRNVCLIACPMAVSAMAVSGVPAGGAAPPPPERTGAGLDAAVHASWTGVPLADWVTRATVLAGRPVILDRRIDPNFPVTLMVHGEPLRTVLERVASSAGAAVDELAGTIRIVPARAAGLAARADAERGRQLARQPAVLRARLAAVDPWGWPAGARPRDLVAGLVASAGVDIEGLDAIPHDHFRAADLPPLPLADRFELVLAHFDLRVAWDGRPGRPAGRIIAIDAGLPAPAPARGPQSSGKQPPKRTVRVHDEYTLRLQAPLDQALTAVAAQLNLTLDLDADSLAARGIAAGEIVRAEVTKASREELVAAIAEPLGLRWRIEGTRLRVFAPGRDAE